MAEKENLSELVGFHPMKCRGANKDGSNFFLKEEDAEQIVIKIYKDGHTEPICRYLRSEWVPQHPSLTPL